MIRSMTGYGEAHHAQDGVSYALEVRSLNNRYFKSNIKLPENLRYLEPEVEKFLRGKIQRGSVSYVLRLRNSSAAAAYEINQAALEQYIKQIHGASFPDGLTPTVDLGSLLSLPGVCDQPEQDETARELVWEIAKSLTEKALGSLLEMRRIEGEALKKDLVGNCDQIRKQAVKIAALAPQVVTEYQDKLRERVSSLLSDAKLELDKDALLREVAIYADRCDINEEIARLTCHLDQFEKMCDSPELAGRRLDFLAQEMLREANTIGSKSNHAEIARSVVEIKSCIDRLKEQVQNVE